MRQQMDKLGDLMRRQKEMMNETHRLEQQRQNGMQQDYGQNQQGQNGKEGQQGQMSEEDIAKALRGLQEGQGKLQSDLEQMMKDLRGIGINPGKGSAKQGSPWVRQENRSAKPMAVKPLTSKAMHSMPAPRRSGHDEAVQQAMGQEGQTGPGRSAAKWPARSIGAARLQGRFLRRLQEYRPRRSGYPARTRNP